MAISKKGNCYVLPKDKESSEARASRFKKLFNRSRISQITRDNETLIPPKTKREIREAAIVREKYRTEREKNRFYQ
ncbi:hypothetical protein KKC94_01420 [Patescibacteria group bacterium]|nr:hypothetical protein [Patescibacteria group bacterium]